MFLAYFCANKLEILILWHCLVLSDFIFFYENLVSMT